MSIFSKNTLLVAILWGLSLSAFAQEVPSGLKATYKKFDRIRLDWQATLAKGESITIKRTYKKNKKEILERNWTDTTPTFIDDLNLKEGDYIYQLRTVAANGKQSAWSNQAIGAILSVALETPKIKDVSIDFNDRIEIAYEYTLKNGETVEVERRGPDDLKSETRFTKAFEAVQLEALPDGRLVDKNVNARVGMYQYRIRVVDKNGNKSAWSEPVIGRVVAKE